MILFSGVQQNSPNDFLVRALFESGDSIGPGGGVDERDFGGICSPPPCVHG